MDADKTIVARKVTVAAGDGTHFLAGLTGPLTGQRVELPQDEAILGRSAGATIRIQDPGVSGRHCRISNLVGQVMVADLGSSNGTFVDEQQITEPQVFPVGSVLQVGNSLFKHEFRSRQEVLEEERLARELEKAAGYVRSLLPPPLATEAVVTEWRFIPCDQLGGDAFGYHWLDDRRFALYLVDVCGHGAAPALHSVAVINVLRKQSLPGVDFAAPTEVLAALNDAYQMEDHANMYFTLWYGVYETDSRRLVYASAGHPPALLRDGASGEARKLMTPNLATGLMPGVEFSSAETDITPDSRLYIYSDGVYEVVTSDGEDWRVDAFLSMVAAGPSAEMSEVVRIESSVRQVMAGEVFDDDFSLLVARFP